MKKLIITQLLITYIFCLQVLKHQCVHDKMKKIYNYESIPPDKEPLDNRNLQNKKPRNMEISYDMDYFKKLPSNDKNKLLTEACEKTVQLAIEFFSQLIKIVPKSESNMRYKPASQQQCGQVVIPQIDKVQGKISDLHIYVQYKIEPEDEYLAYAGWCQFLDGLGPTHGEITFNLGQLTTSNFNDPIEFKDLMEVVIHEIIHILGFNETDIPKWVDSNKSYYTQPTIKKKIRGKDTILLKTPNVLKFAQAYYSCPTLPGMPLENLGEQGSKGSHWKYTAIENEYMNAFTSTTQAYFSGFTTNLLRDTGFYHQINNSMEENIFYGKGAGCDHIIGKCDLTKREFCDPKKQNGLCDYYNLGPSKCMSNQFNEPGCNTLEIYKNAKCWDVKSNINTKEIQDMQGVKFGVESGCFNSNILKEDPKNKKIQVLGCCYKYECSSNGQQVTIWVGSKKVVCTKNLENMSVKGYTGQIQCPENIALFCGFKKFCPNFCSGNGYCLNGKCQCSKKYFGQDCGKKNPFKF
ncbi:leishmanolysin family protein, putative [Ichthyophthirius multifiliis]|uniref:Leishmanolysin family protein, putative n=1 Tax=Ichthyophthirius multifiliis TaxID=5932 RepID=G0R6J8_ICHMU|nr:leishmanolysin family protein, putative [Ichthyophthirius multifiliis]EGR26907.1 leishmanolysin family protein, putative [Ichthyophthirius multifiliis]|eukprot:XP_004023791.1 leishmanolysin family protein, putative [Ichthyophthirius multifiliis]